MQTDKEPFFNVDDFVPELREICKTPPLDPGKILLAAIPVEEPNRQEPLVPANTSRELVSLTDGTEFWHWEAPPLRTLLRGNQQPPVLGDFPEAYNDAFLLFDLHVLEYSKAFGDRRDLEMLKIYSTLRRRPDGRSLGPVHDYLWQAAALVLGTRPLSQAEFEAIMARLERSCRTFALGPTSRNLVAALRTTVGQEHSARMP